MFILNQKLLIMKKNLLTIIGGLLTIGSMFLTFIKPMGIEITGMNALSNDCYIYITCGAVIVIVGLIGKKGLNILSLLLGLGIIGMCIYYYTELKTELVTLEIGYWLLLVGGVLSALGSVMALMQKKV